MYKLVYDDKFDILYIREEGKGNFDYYGDEDENGVVKFKDLDTDELKGFMIYRFANRLGLTTKEKVINIEDIIHKAFKAGEEWGVTYSTWFSPTEEDTEEKIQKAIKEILG